ncbi:hypothetical protein LOC01_10680, partial [Lactobacillus delbrueckii subsp. lactis]|uniref:hypothetical protein n=1 Tax=Lactobacillus delbrueckii TaxID=1584 RepID=UPI001E51CCA9
ATSGEKTGKYGYEVEFLKASIKESLTKPDILLTLIFLNICLAVQGSGRFVSLPQVAKKGKYWYI